MDVFLVNILADADSRKDVRNFHGGRSPRCDLNIRQIAHDFTTEYHSDHKKLQARSDN